MSEYWKSTPKYWCKHCSVYVRDTKLERQNHEATGKHQFALKRFLRDLHRGHEKEEKDKERARREIERLNGVVSGTPSSSSGAGASGGAQPSSSSGASAESQNKKHREQLAALGVAMPDDFRPEMAMAGEWTVTSTKIIEDKPPAADLDETKETTATGVRKREITEEEEEENEAIQKLFKKPRRWGRDTRTAPQEDDAELDALLSGSILTNQGSSRNGEIKAEEADSDVKAELKTEVKAEVKDEDSEPIKQEPDTEPQGLSISTDAEDTKPDPMVKAEVKTENDTGATPIVFKKRKPKGVRQK